MADSKENYINLLKQYCSENSEKDLTLREELLKLFNLISINTTEMIFFKSVRDFIKKTEDEFILRTNLKANLPKGITALDTNIKTLDFYSDDFVKNMMSGDNVDEFLAKIRLSAESPQGKKVREYSALRKVLIRILNKIELKRKQEIDYYREVSGY